MAFFSFILKEHYVAEKELQTNVAAEPAESSQDPEQFKYRPIVAILYSFFLTTMVLVFLETIAVPLVTDQYGWEAATAMTNVCIFLSIGGLGMMILFYLAGVLNKKIDERLVLIAFGIVPMTLGCFFFMPFGHGQMVMETCSPDTTPSSFVSTQNLITGQNFENMTFESLARQQIVNLDDFRLTSMTLPDVDMCTAGCPKEQTWCEYIPQLALPQMIIAAMLLMLGFPMAQSVTMGIYSKLAGIRPQGLWMALLGVVGSTSRIIGPIIVSYIYTNFGTYWTFGTLTVLMLSLLTVLCILYKEIEVSTE